MQDEHQSAMPNDEQAAPGREEPQSEEELRARLEEELRRITVKNILVQTVVTLVNLGGQRLGASEPTRDVRDLAQSRMAIEAVRAILPLLEANPEDADQMKPVRDALAQLQIAYAREVGSAGADQETPAEGAEAPTTPPAQPGEQRQQPRKPPGLWVPPGSSG
jgi:hypothetical protein